jgi:hypothetical protein
VLHDNEIDEYSYPPSHHQEHCLTSVRLLQAVAMLNHAPPGTATTIEVFVYSGGTRRGLPPIGSDTSSGTLTVKTRAEPVARVRIVSWTRALLTGEVLISGQPPHGQTFNCKYVVQDFMSRSAISADGLVVVPMFIEHSGVRMLMNPEQACSIETLNTTLGVGSCSIQVPTFHFPTQAGRTTRTQVTLEVKVWALHMIFDWVAQSKACAA